VKSAVEDRPAAQRSSPELTESVRPRADGLVLGSRHAREGGVGELQNRMIERLWSSLVIVIFLTGCAVVTVSTAPSSEPSPSSLVVGPAIVKGDTPAPDSTPPPKIAFLPGVTLATLADFAGSLAMDCVSYGPAGERSSPYLLRCEAVSTDKTTEVVLEAPYWTLNAIRGLSLTVIPAPGQSTVDKEFAAAAVSALTGVRYGGADTIGTTQWAVAGLHKSECFGNGCSRDVGGVRILLMVGFGGALGMQLDPVGDAT
jgi:hypothetical protein